MRQWNTTTKAKKIGYSDTKKSIFCSQWLLNALAEEPFICNIA